jgi:hypothetical protein
MSEGEVRHGNFNRRLPAGTLRYAPTPANLFGFDNL